MLSVLARICADGSYKIIEITELVKEMLPRFKIDGNELAQIMQYLQDNEMISLKYNDDSVYCISVLPKGRVTNEVEVIHKSHGQRVISKKAVLALFCGCFAAAFFGAILGGLFTKLF